MTRPEHTPMGWDYLFRPDKVQYDSAVPFLGVCQLLAAQATMVLDVGCGRGAQVDGASGPTFQDLRGDGRRVIGIDVDPEAAANPIINEFRLIGPDGTWAVDDQSIDLITSDFTLEHVQDPQAFVAEAARVLRPGGAFVARTVSRRSPLALAARCVPNQRHAKVLSTLQPDRLERDVFPTQYRMNTERDLETLLAPGFDWSVLHRGGLDQYFLRSKVLSRAIAAVEPRMPRGAQTILIVHARRKGSDISSAATPARL